MNLKSRLEKLEQKANPDRTRIAVHLRGSDKWTIDGKDVSEADYLEITRDWVHIHVPEEK